ncbi:MAG TPA: hypothetical protein VEU06_04410 [Micropepsaceae bacterium]|jgi:hypothetical protein|nr:hypothetical protein [Micropepsaceae bacterium]
MSDPSDERKNVARRTAQGHFTASDQRDALAREVQEKQRAKIAAKIANLRSLRLAKEHAEKQSAGAANMKTGDKRIPRKRKED